MPSSGEYKQNKSDSSEESQLLPMFLCILKITAVSTMHFVLFNLQLVTSQLQEEMQHR